MISKLSNAGGGELQGADSTQREADRKSKSKNKSKSKSKSTRKRERERGGASLSLKGRGLALLSQRDHSRVELARKLLPHARALVLAELVDDSDLSNAPVTQPTAAKRVTEVLEWLQAHDYLSDTRFAESRTHARSAKFGNLRIRQELSQHGVSLPPEATQRLKETEFERARELQARKFAGAPSTVAEYAKQSRFLAGRGFSSDSIRQVMRLVGWAAAASADIDPEEA